MTKGCFKRDDDLPTQVLEQDESVVSDFSFYPLENFE
jgi:hypothetical protein